MTTLLNPACDTCYDCDECDCLASKEHFYDNESHRTLTLSNGPNFAGATNYAEDEFQCTGWGLMSDVDYPATDLSGNYTRSIDRNSPFCGFGTNAYTCPPISSNQFDVWDFNNSRMLPHDSCDVFLGRIFSCWGIGVGYNGGVFGTCTIMNANVSRTFNLSASVDYGCTSGGDPTFKLAITSSVVLCRRGYAQLGLHPTTGGVDWTYSGIWTKTSGAHTAWAQTRTIRTENWYGTPYEYYSYTVYTEDSDVTTVDLWVPDPVLDPSGITEYGKVTIT